MINTLFLLLFFFFDYSQDIYEAPWNALTFYISWDGEGRGKSDIEMEVIICAFK